MKICAMQDAGIIVRVGDEFPRSAWLVSKMGTLTAGVQYEPQWEGRTSRLISSFSFQVMVETFFYFEHFRSGIRVTGFGLQVMILLHVSGAGPDND
ncbi:hypothetical protein ACH5RR_011076 [Cinchona calisaya]|uniref:Uncharacterized protein n=1 Tax=Cinchona calisaya TaxID=153742 RepID=A0ABD3A7A7_9GENT